MRSVLFLAVIAVVRTGQATAQDHLHAAMHHDDARPNEVSRSAGQSAFATIAETVALLTADSLTDWTKVDIEALRQHLIDMDDVMIRARSVAATVEGGVSIDVTGEGRVHEAIHRIVVAHSKQLDMMPQYRAAVRHLKQGETLLVTARDPADLATVSRIRALGLAGLLTEGSHHPMHHLMIARGLSPH